MKAIATAVILLAAGACQADNVAIADESSQISSEVEAAYFEVQDEGFGLQMCEDAKQREAADRIRAAAYDLVIRTFGHETAMRLEEEAADHYRTAMVVQCTGDAGVSDLETAFERLSQTATG